ncbi:hypothetical protein [Neptuniibacter sp.]|uniref:hypothetical protein n=1 Tax=Neptuniibacter sp. TaxID=1962643 RepID=UPI003B5BE5A2
MEYLVIENSPQSISHELDKLGLSEEILQTAIDHGAREFKRSTKMHPITHAGVTTYGEIVRALREQLIPLGWKYKTDFGLALTYHPENEISVIVTSGDMHTGLKDGYPSTKNPKGGATTKVVPCKL